MNEEQDNKETIEKLILRSFHLDKLCPTCNEPMEIDNNVRCKLCSFKKSLRAQVDIADTAVHSLRATIGK